MRINVEIDFEKEDTDVGEHYCNCNGEIEEIISDPFYSCSIPREKFQIVDYVCKVCGHTVSEVREVRV